MNIPKTVFGVVAQAKALGLDVNAVLEQLGLPKGAFDGLLSSLNKPAVPSADGEPPQSRGATGKG
jgi:hypothetical protein